MRPFVKTLLFTRSVVLGIFFEVTMGTGFCNRLSNFDGAAPPLRLLQFARAARFRTSLTVIGIAML